MAEATFDVVFSGKLQPGCKTAEVRENLARLFKIDPARLAALFTGDAVPIKRGVDAATALQYQQVLAKAGALVELVESSASAAQPVLAPTAAVTAPPSPVQDSHPGPRAAPVTVPPAIAARGVPAAPDYGIAEPGVVLVEPVVVPPATIDTRHLSVAPAGALLVEPATVVTPAFDLDGLDLDPPGTPLSEAATVAPAQYDLSGLSLVAD